MILLSGGLMEAQFPCCGARRNTAAANPQLRLGQDYKLPVIYAGNKDAKDKIEDTLGEKVDLDLVENIRPVLEQENLEPSRDKIHDLFMEHVMQQHQDIKVNVLDRCSIMPHQEQWVL